MTDIDIGFNMGRAADANWPPTSVYQLQKRVWKMVADLYGELSPLTEAKMRLHVCEQIEAYAKDFTWGTRGGLITKVLISTLSAWTIDNDDSF